MDSSLESQLEKANAKLTALQAEYEEFVYIVSHDLSAPMRQVEGFAEIVVNKHSESFDEKTKRHFELIFNGAAQTTKILEAITAYSRLNTRAKPFAHVDCNAIFADVLDDLSFTINEKGAKISCDALPELVGEIDQIKLLFKCLVENALLYQYGNTKPIIVLRVSEIGESWLFRLSDNGIGIADNLTDKVFKVLRRGVSPKKYPGLGMGLAVAKKIVEKHQGELSIDSTSEQGTTFSFTIAKDLPDE